eukprot:354574-Chlamydomonas_euryale.AAC.3
MSSSLVKRSCGATLSMRSKNCSNCWSTSSSSRSAAKSFNACCSKLPIAPSPAPRAASTVCARPKMERRTSTRPSSMAARTAAQLLASTRGACSGQSSSSCTASTDPTRAASTNAAPHWQSARGACSCQRNSSVIASMWPPIAASTNACPSEQSAFGGLTGQLNSSPSALVSPRLAAHTNTPPSWQSARGEWCGQP